MITNKQITKWNEDFKKLTKAEKRVAIAQDVIAQIRAKKYVPETGAYVTFRNNCELEEDDSIQKNFDKVSCNVCAIGSMFMSNVKFTNKFSMYEVNNMDGTEQADILKKYFNLKDLALIEFVFEDWNVDDYNYINDWDHTYNVGIAYGEKVSIKEIKRIETAQRLFKGKDQTDRLLKVMKHIIKNNGKLVL